MEFIWPDRVFLGNAQCKLSFMWTEKSWRWKEQPLALVLPLKYLGHDQHLASLRYINQFLKDLLRVHDLIDHFILLSYVTLSHYKIQRSYLISEELVWELHKLPRKPDCSSTCKRSTCEHKSCGAQKMLRKYPKCIPRRWQVLATPDR